MLVELARRQGVELRCVGRAHSPSDLMMSKGWVVLIHSLSGLIAVNQHDTADTLGPSSAEGGPSIEVFAGTYLSEMHTYLAAAKPLPLAMSNVGSISEQTVGGLVSTASHGTGVHFPVLSASVLALEIICALPREQGGTQLIRCSRTMNARLFNASLCGLGATGLIVKVKMAAEPAFQLRQMSEEVRFDFIFGRKTSAPSIPAMNEEEGAEQAHKKRKAKSGSFGKVRKDEKFFANKSERQSIGKMLAHGRWIPPCDKALVPRVRLGASEENAGQTIYPLPEDAIQSGIAACDAQSAEEDDEETRLAQKRLEQVVESAQHVRCMWFPQVGICTLLRADRTNEVSSFGSCSSEADR